MVKRVLAAHFSQSGQAARVLASIVAPLQTAGDVAVTQVALDVVPPYPFPWPFWRFLDTFPETVLLDAPKLAPLSIAQDEQFDLIIIAYPVWFLSPPPPIAAFLLSPAGRALLRGRPVVTVTACRNMWVMAQETVKRLLSEIGARHIDQIVLVDRSHPLTTFITTPRWVLTGRRDPFLGLPAAGVADDDIRAACRFGIALRDGLRRGDERRGAPMLAGLRACEVDPRLVASERIGIRSFRIWGRALRALGPPGASARRALLACYLVFLIVMIVTIVPVNILLRRLLAPFAGERLRRVRRELEGPSGSDSERVGQTHG